MNYRPLRVANLLRDELGMMLARDMEFSGALVTLTEVDISKKLDVAHVYISVLPENKSTEVLRKLKASASDLRHGLLRKLNIKPMPTLLFSADTGNANAATVEKALLGE